SFQNARLGRIHAAEDVPRRDVGDIRTDRADQSLELLWRREPLPIVEVAVDIVFKVASARRAIVAPGVAAKELVTARPGEHDLDELACQLRRIVVGVALSDPRLFEVTDQRGERTLHVA